MAIIPSTTYFDLVDNKVGFMIVKLQVFTNTVMLKLNFIIRLNGTIANTIRLCHNTGVEKVS